MKTLRRLCALVLALATLFSLAGCVDHSWSVKVDGEKISAGVYIYYMMTAFNDASQEVEDEKADILTATIDGKTGREWINQRTIDYCKRHFAVERLCAERNVTLSEDDINEINSNLNTIIYYYGAFYEQAGVSVESVREVYENSYLYSNLLHSYFDGKGEYALKEEDIKKYFSENYFAYKTIDAPFTYTSNNQEVKYKDDEIKKRQDIINQLYTEATGTDEADIDALNKKFVNRDLKEGEKEKDPAKLTIQFTTKDSAPTKYGEEFFEELKKAKVGDFLKFEVKDKGIYLVQKCDEFSEDSKEYKKLRETCIGAIAEDDFIKILDEKAATINYTFNNRAIKEYTLDSIVELLNS